MCSIPKLLISNLLMRSMNLFVNELSIIVRMRTSSEKRLRNIAKQPPNQKLAARKFTISSAASWKKNSKRVKIKKV